MGPRDVELAPNVVVQPDVFVLLNDNLQKITEARVICAPDLAIEISSPSTAIHDRHRKYVAYARAGVKEYWIADPKAHTIEVLFLEDGAYRSAGVFSGEQTLPSQVVPNFPVQVQQFFA
jgi:Uma2 family endonuclease